MNACALKSKGLIAVLLVSGCVIDVSFDPSGDDVALAGTWTVDGAAPTAENCGTIVMVELRVYELYGSGYYVDTPLRADCSVGMVSSVALEQPNILQADDYRLRFVSFTLDENGDQEELERSDFIPISQEELEAGDFSVATYDFTTTP